MNLFLGIKLLSFVVGFFTLLAGAIGVSNIMLVIVKERTQEFGIRRALGAAPSQIFSQIIMESAVLTIVAGAFGVIFGVWLLEGLNAILEQNGGGGSFTQPGVEMGIVLIALTILIIVGLLAGIIPGRRAIKVRPITALRDE
jgi:putative ABC transport system permease protein